MTATPSQIALMRDIRLKGAIDALLFSRHRSEGVGLREAGMLTGVGDSTALSEKGLAAVLAADGSISPTPIRHDAGAALCTALEASATAHGCPFALKVSDWTRWASATFTGHRHDITIEAAESCALDGWLSSLLDLDTEVPGLLLSDILIVSVNRADGMARVRFEALTVDSL